MYSDVFDGLRMMREGRNVIFINKGILTSAFKMDPFLSQKVIMFANNEQAVWANTIFPKHSPLKAMFSKGLKTLRESGLMYKLQSKWEGLSIPTEKHDSTEARLST